MAEYQQRFVEFALEQNVLRFGEFTLKSGRTSPYFFNSGLFNTGGSLAKLGEFYADAIVASGVEFDCLFGPAYKGIPLVAAIGIALHSKHNRDVPYAFNRKEAKDHGEGGLIVGKLEGKVLIVDDVITAGTAIRESMELLAAQPNCTVSGICVAMDRQEKFQDGLEASAIQQVQTEYSLPVFSIIQMTHIIGYVEAAYRGEDRDDLLPRIREYFARYGVLGGA